MVVYEQHLHPDSKEDLTIHLPETMLHQDVKISVEVTKPRLPHELPDEPDELDRRIAEDPFWKWVDSLKIDTRGWKFNREEANERY